MVAKFTCANCGEVTEVEFDPHNPKENGMLTLRLFIDGLDMHTPRKCRYCGVLFSIPEGKEEVNANS